MNYEAYRSEFVCRMIESGIGDAVGAVTRILDEMAGRYEIKTKQTALAVVEGVPEIVRLYIASRFVENVKKSTLDFYFCTLKRFFLTCRKSVRDITTNDVRGYLYWYKDNRKVKDSSLETIRIILNGFFQWLVDEGQVESNPVRRVAPIKFQYAERVPLTELELARMRAACKTKRQKALVDFLFSTGCRVAELADMTIDDVDFSRSEVRILHGKGDKSRTSYLNAESVVSLRAYLDSRKDNCPSLFPSITAPHKVNKRSYEVEIAKVAKAAGIGRQVTPHTFRHTAATLALRRGMKIEEVQRFLGH